VQCGSSRKTTVAAIGAVLISPVILKQASFYRLLSSTLLVLNLTPGHHTMAAYNYNVYPVHHL
jgi:hypothetical protein